MNTTPPNTNGEAAFQLQLQLPSPHTWLHSPPGFPGVLCVGAVSPLYPLGSGHSCFLQ